VGAVVRGGQRRSQRRSGAGRACHPPGLPTASPTAPPLPLQPCPCRRAGLRPAC